MEQLEVQSSNSLKTLHPFIDKECLLGVGGRLEQSTFPYQTMHLMILPSYQHFTKFVVSAEHVRLHHAGPQLLKAFLRERCWFPKIRNLVKQVIHRCLTCYRFKAQPTQQIMSELPSTQIQYSGPFLTKDVDYAGPISLRLGPPRSETITKSYFAIFVCFVTKAVHIDVESSLSTEAFLADVGSFIAFDGNQGSFVKTMVPNFKVLPLNFMQSTKSFNAHHR